MRRDGEGAVSDKIFICHWKNSGEWVGIAINTSALDGHENHDFDIWPPVDGVTDGMNWDLGEDILVNGCETTDRPTPTASVTPEPTMSESASPTVSLSPTPKPTVTVTAVPSPIPTECETVNETAVLFPIAIALMMAAGWDLWRRRQ
jgi:hypothetical protein